MSGYVLLAFGSGKNLSWDILPKDCVDGSSYMVVGQKRRVKWHGSKCQGELLAFASTVEELEEGSKKFNEAWITFDSRHGTVTQFAEERTKEPKSQKQTKRKEKNTCCQQPTTSLSKKAHGQVPSFTERDPQGHVNVPSASTGTPRKRKMDFGTSCESQPKKNSQQVYTSPQPSDSSVSEDEEQHLSEYEQKRQENIKELEIAKAKLGLGISDATREKEICNLKRTVNDLQKQVTKLHSRVSKHQKLLETMVLYGAVKTKVTDAELPIPSSTSPAPTGAADTVQSVMLGESKVQQGEDIEIGGHKVDRVCLANALCQKDAGSMALKLMGCIFTSKELVNGNLSGHTKSKDVARQKTIKPLDKEKMKYIEQQLEQRWPGSFKQQHRNMTQKCTDAYNNPKLVHLRDVPEDA